MGQRTGASLMAVTVLALLLVGCNGAESERRAQQERQRAAAVERQRQEGALVSRCRRQQAAVKLKLQELNNSSAELTRLHQQSYSPLPRPAAADPELLARFTREDQELELERYEQALARWRQDNGAERQRWQEQQQRRRQLLTASWQQTRAELEKLGVPASPEAQIAWSSCNGPQLADVMQSAAAGLR